MHLVCLPIGKQVSTGVRSEIKSGWFSHSFEMIIWYPMYSHIYGVDIKNSLLHKILNEKAYIRPHHKDLQLKDLFYGLRQSKEISLENLQLLFRSLCFCMHIRII